MERDVNQEAAAHCHVCSTSKELTETAHIALQTYGGEDAESLPAEVTAKATQFLTSFFSLRQRVIDAQLLPSMPNLGPSEADPRNSDLL